MAEPIRALDRPARTTTIYPPPYDAALAADGEALVPALARNVFPDEPEAAGAWPLAAYVREQRSHLAAQESGAIAGGQVSFKEPTP